MASEACMLANRQGHEMLWVDACRLLAFVMDVKARRDSPARRLVCRPMGLDVLPAVGDATVTVEDVALPDPAGRLVSEILLLPPVGRKRRQRPQSGMSANEPHGLSPDVAKPSIRLRSYWRLATASALTDPFRVRRIRERRSQSEVTRVDTKLLAADTGHFVQGIEWPNESLIGDPVSQTAGIAKTTFPVPTNATKPHPALVAGPAFIPMVELGALVPRSVPVNESQRLPSYVAEPFVGERGHFRFLAAAAVAIAVRDNLRGHAASLLEVVLRGRRVSSSASPLSYPRYWRCVASPLSFKGVIV